MERMETTLHELSLRFQASHPGLACLSLVHGTDCTLDRRKPTTSEGVLASQTGCLFYVCGSSDPSIMTVSGAGSSPSLGETGVKEVDLRLKGSSGLGTPSDRLECLGPRVAEGRGATWPRARRVHEVLETAVPVVRVRTRRVI